MTSGTARNPAVICTKTLQTRARHDCLAGREYPRGQVFMIRGHRALRPRHLAVAESVDRSEPRENDAVYGLLTIHALIARLATEGPSAALASRGQSLVKARRCCAAPITSRRMFGTRTPMPLVGSAARSEQVRRLLPDNYRWAMGGDCRSALSSSGAATQDP
jgi:hypothetical protein